MIHESVLNFIKKVNLNSKDHDSFLVSTITMRTSCPPTIIAKLLAASATHCTTSIIFLHVKITPWAFPIVCILNKINKFLVILVKSIVDFVLVACHSLVIKVPAFETVMFLADRAFVVINIISLKGNAPCSRTPLSGSILFNKGIKCIFLIFFL